MSELIARQQFLFFRGSVRTSEKFTINRWELWLLVSLYYFLKYKKRDVSAKDEFFETLSGNSRQRAKFEGYYTGILNKGFIGTFEYISRPGSLSIGLTDKGKNAIDHYFLSMAEMYERFPITGNSLYTVEEREPARHIKRSA